MIGAFDDYSFGLGVYFLHGVGTTGNWGELMYLVLVVFLFDLKVDLVSGFDFFVFLSKAFIYVALVASLSLFESNLCVGDGFRYPLFPSLLKF